MRSFLGGNIDETSETAELLVSELVTNACSHGGPDDISVGIGRHDDVIRIEVHDTNPVGPVVGNYSTLKVSGRGLLIIERLSKRRGWNPDGGGKTVWVEFATPATDAAGISRR